MNKSIALSCVLLLPVMTMPAAAQPSGAEAELVPRPYEWASPGATPDAVVCANASSVRNLYFGDLHVHTTLSHDGFAFGTGAGPEEAYANTRAELDFAAVTDHAEFLAETVFCRADWSVAYDAPGCVALRAGLVDIVALTDICRSDDPIMSEQACQVVGDKMWARIQYAANAANTDCEFSAFIGYEFSLGSQASGVRHRNVIYANGVVPDRVVSQFEQTSGEGLWQELRDTCVEAEGCAAIAIPHNSNRSDGLAFVADELTAESAALKYDTEPLVEIFQHKGSSECYPYLNNDDEDCGFEQLSLQQLLPPGSSEVPGQSFVREALKDGLSLQDTLGVNPFRYGVIASTDTHEAIGGRTGETTYEGHVGTRDDEPLERLRGDSPFYNPGGLAGVWAMQNTRDAIFDSLRNRETFATSGTRLAVRFFGAWDYAPDICADSDLLDTAYASGVPMGGELRSAPGVPPVFIAIAERDPAAARIAEIQVVKGWVGDAGPEESVVSIASYETQAGADHACVTWSDPTFDGARAAFYYLRVLEMPAPRWSTFDCQALDVDCSAPYPIPASCCDGSVPETIQERAWTSPIWYRP